MAFESVQIRSTRNGGTAINGYREDLAAGETIGLALSSTVGISTFRWELVGRPEGSVAGGAGPEPILLGMTATVSFVVDNATIDGTYIVTCTVNEAAPSRTRIAVALAQTAGTLADGRVLRMLSAFESAAEDTASATIKQGWAKMAARWLQKTREVATGFGNSKEFVVLFNRAKAALGTDDLIVYWEDFRNGAAEWDRTLIGAGGSITLNLPSISGGHGVGSIRLQSGTAGERTQLKRGNATNGFPAIIPAQVGTNKWYISTRINWSLTLTDPGKYAGISLFDNTGTVKAVIGTHGTVGAVAVPRLWTAGGNFLSLSGFAMTVSLVECWRDGTTTFLKRTENQLGELPPTGDVTSASGTLPTPAALCGLSLDIQTTDQQNVVCDYIFVAIPRNLREAI